MKKLYAVTIERTIVVMADDENDAVDVAGGAERDEIMNEPDYCSPQLVTELRKLPKVWHDSIPWGSEDDKTCQQVLTVSENGL